MLAGDERVRGLLGSACRQNGSFLGGSAHLVNLHSELYLWTETVFVENNVKSLKLRRVSGPIFKSLCVIF